MRAPLLVIDLQSEMFGEGAMPAMCEAEAIAGRVRALLARARAEGRKVAFIRHDGRAGDSLAPGEAGWKVWPGLGQLADEPTFAKQVGDAFSNPALGRWLAGQGAEAVVLLGAQTEHCVAATVRGALAAGLGVSVVEDAHGTWDSATETAAAIVARHNAAFAEAGARLVSTASLLDDSSV